MNVYPLIRNRWSNEHLLAVLFLTVSLYQLPDWTVSVISLIQYVLIVIVALILDTTINYLRYRKPVCAVSAAVTAAVLYPVVRGLPGWAGLLGIAAALILGKHIWGGIGKNILNPAVTAMLLLSLVFPLKLSIFKPSSLILPAMVLSVPFLALRFFPGIGLMAGMLCGLFLNNNLSFSSVAAYGVVFWGCVVITDPATSTDKPLPGLLLGFLSGILPLLFGSSLLALSSALLFFNAASFIINRSCGRRQVFHLRGIRIKPPASAGKNVEMVDLTANQHCAEYRDEDASAEDILVHIERNGVFGMGGAGFPTHSKIRTVIKSGARDKYLIVNGMECDPGLVHDKWLLYNRQPEIAKGISALGNIIKFNEIYFITRDTRDLMLPKPVKVCRLPDRYPYGAERILVEKILGINIPADSNPAQYGVLVLNVQTVYSVYEAVYLNKRADTRLITVADLFEGTSKVVKVKLGDRVEDIIGRTVGSKGIAFVGGGIMQARPAEDSEAIDRTTNFVAVGMLPRYKESTQCINCGLCRFCCPMGLNVRRIADLADRGKLLEAQTYEMGRCISCGICSYVCPAGRNLSGRTGKLKKRASAKF